MLNLKMNKTISFILSGIIILFLVSNLSVFAQRGRPKELRKLTASPEEIISMSNSLPFNEAQEVFNDLSKRYLKKIIIDPTKNTNPIGVNIDNMHWLDAFELVIRTNSLEFEELPECILIKSPAEVEPGVVVQQQQLPDQEHRRLYETREVTISAIFFEANVNKLRQVGSSFSLLSALPRITIAGDTISETSRQAIMSAGEAKSSLFQMGYKRWSADGVGIGYDEITTLFKLLESRQLGEVIASPKITVMSEKEGTIQIGTNFSITVKDFAGNAVTDFVETGIIITVKPEIITSDTTIFIHLEISAQKSSGSASASGVTVNTSAAETSILLLDGEETMIAGLYTSETIGLREGVPFLKDLPWWIFGLRYLFGYESKSEIRKELIMLLRADLVPSLEERISIGPDRLRNQRVLEQSINKYEEQLERWLDQMKSGRK